jgi:hypothetical protein
LVIAVVFPSCGFKREAYSYFSLFPYGIIIPDSALEIRDAGQKSQVIFATHMPVMSGDLMKNTTRRFDNTSLKINPLKACLRPRLKE